MCTMFDWMEQLIGMQWWEAGVGLQDWQSVESLDGLVAVIVADRGRAVVLIGGRKQHKNTPRNESRRT